MGLLPTNQGLIGNKISSYFAALRELNAYNLLLLKCDFVAVIVCSFVALFRLLDFVVTCLCAACLGLFWVM